MPLRLFYVLVLLAAAAVAQEPAPRPRARELGIEPGIMSPRRLNAITDVPGVRVGHATIVRGENIRTGVTAVLPHGGNLFREKVRGAVFVGNGFGKLMGSTQVNELGEIETPILLTSTLAVPRVADALLDYMLALPGNEDVRSINPLVAETNDGRLNDIRARAITRDDVFAAIRGAQDGPVAEGSVGAGTGTIAFGWKGGIGTASRGLPPHTGGWTVGVLVQTNYGGQLTINGAPVGRVLGRKYIDFPKFDPKSAAPPPPERATADGSIIIVVATDAPVEHRMLMRMAQRGMMGLARTGSFGSHGSGDYVIAFSTHRGPAQPVSDDAASELFLAVIEATEEAIYNSLFRATTVTGNGRTVEALPIDRTLEVLKKHNALGKP